MPEKCARPGDRRRNLSGKLTPLALKRVTKLLGAPQRKALSKWPDELIERLLYGDPDLIWTAYIDRGARVERRDRPWRGLVGIVEQVYRFSRLPTLEQFRVRQSCPMCEGGASQPHRAGRAF